MSVAENHLTIHGFHPDGDFMPMTIEEDEQTVKITIGDYETIKLNSNQMDIVQHFLKESSNNS